MKEKIQKEIAEIEKEINRLQKDTAPIAPAVSLGRLTRMEAIANKGINESILIENQNKLVKLKAALDAIDSGIFGICHICHKPISQARMEYIPETTTCIDCA